MITRGLRVWLLAIGFGAIEIALGAQRPPEAPFTLAFEHEQSGFARTFENEQSRTSEQGELVLKSEGKEAVSCGDAASARRDVFFKQGSASGRAIGRLERAGVESLNFLLSSDVQALGGIQTTCATCLGSTCLLPSTKPSDADAQTTSSGRVIITFQRPAAGSRYAISIDAQESTLHGATVSHRLDDGDRDLLKGRTLPTTVEFVPETNDRVVLRVDVTSYAGSRGASVFRNASGLLRLQVGVRLVPLVGLDGTPAQLGANATPQDRAERSGSALLLFGGIAHCGATLIDRETAITAADCVRQLSYSDQAKLLVLPTATTSRVEVRSFAILGDEHPPVLPRLERQDDVALIRLQGPGDWRGATMRANYVRLENFVGTSAAIEGFVHDESSIRPSRDSLAILEVTGTSITLKPPPGGCRFTIGSGVFVTYQGTPRLVGLFTRPHVPGECRATRLDPYRSWLSGNSR